MSGLILTPDGLILREWNSDLRCQYDIKKRDDVYVVTLKSTGEEVGRYASRNEADDLYWCDTKEDLDECVLRDIVTIQDDVTPQHLLDAITYHPKIERSVCRLFGDTWRNDFKRPNVPVQVVKNYFLTDHSMKVFLSTIVDNKSSEPRIHKQPLAFLSGSGVKLSSYNCEISLLELIAAFCSISHPVVNHFVLENDELVLQNEYGVAIENVQLRDLLNYIQTEEITVNHIFQWVDKHEEVKNFIKKYSWCRSIDQFHTEGSLPPEAADLSDNELRHANIYRRIHANKFKKSDPFVFNDDMDFRCFGVVSEDRKRFHEPTYCVRFDTQKTTGNSRIFYESDGAVSEEIALKMFEDFCKEHEIENYTVLEVEFSEGTEAPEFESYAIGFSPIYHYSHLPLTITNFCSIIQDKVLSRKGNVLADAQVIWEGDVENTLLEVLDALYWEISFYGAPESRDDKAESLREQVDNVKELSPNPDKRNVKIFKTFNEMIDYDADNDPDGPFDFYQVDSFADEEE